ncbi:unnamed protein product [Closterium sp. Naga37s-1]|nr:unnamed protein product [Closterium sp. Naga37s-1]
MKVARGLVPTEGGAPGGAGAGQQRKGARILAAETFAHHAPLPDYLDHIPRRQALATCTRKCYPFPSFPTCFGIAAPLFPTTPVSCGRTTVTIPSQYLGPYDLHNDIYNMTFYNGCAYNVTSPLRVFYCFNFGNVWEGILDNPDPNPSQYQQGEIFVQTTPGYCEMCMNRGASGTLQMLPGETVNIVYAYTWDFRPCVQELRFGNGNSYSMTNTTECQLAQARPAKVNAGLLGHLIEPLPLECLDRLGAELEAHVPLPLLPPHALVLQVRLLHLLRAVV